MKKLYAIFLSLGLLLASFAAEAQTINNLGAGRGSVVGTDLFPSYQGANPAVRPSASQMGAYVYSLMNGDCTASGTGGIVCLKTNGSAFTAAATTAIGTSGATIPLLSTANTWTLGQTFSAITLSGASGCATFTAGALGSTGSACGTGSATITAGSTATSGFTAGHFVQSNGSTAVDATAVTSIATGCGVAGGTITTTGTVTAALGARINTTTSDPIVAGDCGNVVYENSASSVAVSIAQAGTTGFAANTFFMVCNINAGVATITPTTSTIGGASTLVVNAGSAAHPTCVGFRSDGTNYTIDDTVMGAGVAAALGNSVSSAGGFPLLIGAGTAALGTSAIGAGACGTATTVPATGVATTDTITVGFNGDPTATTGYLPTAMLTIVPYPTANNVNFKQCNLTGSSITPSALTVNWRVNR